MDDITMQHSSITRKVVSGLPLFIAYLAIAYLTYVLFLNVADLFSHSVPNLPQAYTPDLTTLSSL